MITDPGPWVKFWWKGVDIMADVVKTVAAAGIVATVAYFTWDQKKKRERKHAAELQIQTEALDRKFRAERAQSEQISARKERIRHWKAELQDWLNRFPRREANGMQMLFARYEEWLGGNGLIAWGNNLKEVRRWHGENFIRVAEHGIENDLELIEQFRNQILNTDLPEAEDDTFPW